MPRILMTFTMIPVIIVIATLVHNWLSHIWGFDPVPVLCWVLNFWSVSPSGNCLPIEVLCAALHWTVAYPSAWPSSFPSEADAVFHLILSGKNDINYININDIKNDDKNDIIVFFRLKNLKHRVKVSLNLEPVTSVLTDCTCSLAQLKENKENIHFHARVAQNP